MVGGAGQRSGGSRRPSLPIPQEAACSIQKTFRSWRVRQPGPPQRTRGAPGATATPSTLGVTPSTLGVTPSTLGPTPSTLGATPSTLGATPSTLWTTPSTLVATPGTLGVTPSTPGATHPPPAWADDEADFGEQLMGIDRRSLQREEAARRRCPGPQYPV